MAQLTMVKPGELIRAEQWNLMVAALQGLTGPVSAGTIPVPNLFGLTLSNALAIITLPSTQLSQGTIIDSLGNLVDPTQSTSGPLIVLNQSPAAGSTTVAGASVNLVVSPAPNSVPPPPKVPSISGFKPTQVNIGAQVEIDGLSFDSLPSNNKVTFAGVASSAPSGQSNPVQLFVIVPTGIPGAPTGAGQTLDVNVVVTTPAGGASQAGKVTILPPLANPLPTIQSFAPAGGTVHGTVTITGTGFDPTPANNTVNFDNVTAVPTSATNTQLVVTIPTGINGLSGVPSFRSVPITVRVAGQTSPSVNYGISNLS